jgi:hypothetical protein
MNSTIHRAVDFPVQKKHKIPNSQNSPYHFKSSVTFSKLSCQLSHNVSPVLLRCANIRCTSERGLCSSTVPEHNLSCVQLSIYLAWYTHRLQYTVRPTVALFSWFSNNRTAWNTKTRYCCHKITTKDASSPKSCFLQSVCQYR